MDILLFTFMVLILSFVLPALLIYKLAKPYDKSWGVPVFFIVWILLSIGTVKLASITIVPYFVDFKVITENVCTVVEKVEPSWR